MLLLIVGICCDYPVAQLLLVVHSKILIRINRSLLIWLDSRILAEDSIFQQVLIEEEVEEGVVGVVASQQVFFKHEEGDLGNRLPGLPRVGHGVHLVPDRVPSHVDHCYVYICCRIPIPLLLI